MKDHAIEARDFIRNREGASLDEVKDLVVYVAMLTGWMNILLLGYYLYKRNLFQKLDLAHRALQARYQSAVANTNIVSRNRRRANLCDMAAEAVGAGASNKGSPDARNLQCGICYRSDGDGCWLAMSCGHVVCSDCATHPSMKARRECMYCKKDIRFVLRLYL